MTNRIRCHNTGRHKPSNKEFAAAKRKGRIGVTPAIRTMSEMRGTDRRTNMIEITKRVQELLAELREPTLQEMAEEVRASLPPTRTMLARYMRNNRGLF